MIKVFLAGTSSFRKLEHELTDLKYVLESYFYFADWQIPYLKKWDAFILDSGAFTFANATNNVERVDFDKYLIEYANFVKKHNIQYFMELDIDNIVGLEKIVEYRHKLEKITGKKCIPVWNVWRGIEDYIKICKNYDYIAIGRMGQSGLNRNKKVLKKLINIANKHNTKVHLLGFTPRDLKEYGAYSCDSTTWIGGARFGEVHLFKNGKINVVPIPKNKKVNKNYLEITEHNLKQWKKLVEYCDRH